MRLFVLWSPSCISDSSQVDSGSVWTRRALQAHSHCLVSVLEFWPVPLSLWTPSTPRRWCQQWTGTSGSCPTTTTSMPLSCSSHWFSCLERLAVSLASAASLTFGSGPWWPSEECLVLPSAMSQASRSSLPVHSHTTSQGLQRPVRRLLLRWCTTRPLKACCGGAVTCWFWAARQHTHGSRVEKWRRLLTETLRTQSKKNWSQGRKAAWVFKHSDKLVSLQSCCVTCTIKYNNYMIY